MKNKLLLFILVFLALFISCHSRYLQVPILKRTDQPLLPGSAFFDTVKSMYWKDREALAMPLLLSGNMPSFLLKFSPIHVSILDSTTNRTIHATYYVSSDYVSIGTDNDWVRIPLTPMAAQQLADTLHCFLPTKKIVDDIYQQAKIKLSPISMFAFRDSAITMYQHHLMIEGQRKLKKGLIAGIKKDLVLSDKIIRHNKPDREAIYGWHQLNGKPIQPLYAGHVNWWVDYSHGTRLIYRKIKVDGKLIDYIDILKNPRLKRLLCDEQYCDSYRY